MVDFPTPSSNRSIVVLYNPLGRTLLLERGFWHTALFEALAMGWRPTGTVAPPRRLGIKTKDQWQGDYLELSGQEMTRNDALEFGLALGRTRKIEFDDLCAFSLASGFLICEPAEELQEKISRFNMGKSAGVEVSEAAAEEAREHRPPQTTGRKPEAGE
jgi:hypothetical protein